RALLSLSSEWQQLTDAKTISFSHIQDQHKSFCEQFQENTKQLSREKSSKRNRYSHLSPLFDDVCKKLNKAPQDVTRDDFTLTFDISAPAAQTQVFNESISRSF